MLSGCEGQSCMKSGHCQLYFMALVRQVAPVALVLLAASHQVHAQYDKGALKAMFLEATTRFITWPDTAAGSFSDTTEPFIIGVFGKDTILSVLKKTFAGKKIKGKQVKIREFSLVSEIPHCHLLFIATSMKTALPVIIPIISNLPILTVGDTPGYAERGTILNLSLENSKVRFKINESAALASGLKISYLLMKMGKVVHTDGGGI
jgi:hypothetical protein